MSTPYEKDRPQHAENADLEHGDMVKDHTHTAGDIKHGDRALAYIGDERIDLTEEDNRRIRRKTDKVILSMLCWVYFLQIIDKSVLGLGNVWGLSKDTNLHGSQYSTISTMNAIAQLAWQPFSSYIIVRVPARTLMTVLCFGWGTAQACMAASHNFGGLMATRFLLGLFEAGCLPLFSVLTAQWYRRSEQPLRVAAWYSTNGLATIFAALLSWALGHVKSDKIHEWQLLFIIVGVITVFTAPVIWFMVDSDIPSARFLTEQEKAMAIERLRANQTGTGSNEFKWSHVGEAFYDVKTYLWLFMSLLLNIGASVTNAFGPTLIKGFGFDNYITTLLNMPFGFLQFLCILAASYAAQVFRIKSAILAIFVIPVIVGLALLFYEGTHGLQQGPRLAGYYLLAFLFGGNPLIVSWMVANTGGQTKKTVIISIYNAGASAGNIIGPLLFTDKDKPAYVPGVKAVLGIFCALLGVIGFQVFSIFTLNKVRQKQRVAFGKPKFIKDTSMSSKYEAFGQEDQAGEGPRLGQNALLDLTDYKNDEFVYVY
ncbi:putative transporter [Vanrija pseudolonga]|uniref:Purtative transporter n=1 Tax=Vanrija pseudolonga TaxID=143232 RepID=A0AAF1BPD5_9TREE|nr:purtative transporter [Vanrija pseudolonga]